MTDTSTTGITEVDGVLMGPYRRSINAASGQRGSIHDDATASRLGFRGGTVAGSVHLDLFPPLLLHAFGRAWFDRGSLSINFVSPTTDREPVRAVIGQPEPRTDAAQPAQVAAVIERDDGMTVGEGTAAVGEPAEPSALRGIDLHRFPPGQLRILDGVVAGSDIPAKPMTVDAERQATFLERGLVTEPLPWYRGESPWGPPVAFPQNVVHHLFRPGSAHLGRTVSGRGGGVGLFGAIEIENLNGPLLVGPEYVVSGRVLAVGQSPKTEYAWFETTAEADGTPVARLLMQLRWMKASSPLYKDQPPAETA